MQWITVATPPFDSIEQFERVRAEVGDNVDGLEASWVGRSGDKLQVVNLWTSKAHADRFFGERLGPAIAKALGPEPVGSPTVMGIDVIQSNIHQPVA